MHYVDVRNRQRIVLIKKRLRTTSDSSSSEACEPNDPPTVRSMHWLNEEQSRKQLADGAGKPEVIGNVRQLPDCCGVSEAMTGCPCAEGQRSKERRSCVSAAHSAVSLLCHFAVYFVLFWRQGVIMFEQASTCTLAAPSRACRNCGQVPQPLPYNLLLTSSEMVTTRNLGRRYLGILCVRKMIHKFKIST